MLIGVFVRVCDEDKIICDFVKHYLFLNFDKIIIYDYNSQKHVKDTLSENNLIDSKIIIKRKNVYIENTSYIEGINENKDLDWLLICDCDEFLYIKDNNIKKFLSQFSEDTCTIVINWVVFGNGGIKTYDKNKTIYEQFIIREKYNHFWNNFPKSIIKPKYIDTSKDTITVHIIESLNYLTKNVYNEIPEFKYVSHSQCIDYKLSDSTPVVLFHYMTLDLESMLEKKKKYERIGSNSQRYSIEWYYNYKEHISQSFKDDVTDDRMIKLYDNYNIN
jgi:hypothetical protein